MITTRITFPDNPKPEEFAFHHTAGDGWRFLADNVAVQLVPFCDSLARTVDHPPLFDRLEIWPVSWSLPDSLLTEHPEDVALMRKKFLAGEYDGPSDPPLTDATRLQNLADWLNDCGKRELWMLHRTPEMERCFLHLWTPPASTLWVYAYKGTEEPHLRGTVNDRRVCLDDLKRIQFRADFHHGPHCVTIFLADCAKAPLTIEEVRLSPGYIEKQEKLAGQHATVLKALKAIKSDTAPTRTDVSVLLGKKVQRERKWHQNGGRATSKWKGHEKEAAELARVMRQAREDHIRDKHTKRGADKWAMMRGRSWWKKEFKDAPLEDFLNHISPSSLRRVMLKDWRKGRKSKT